MFKCRCRLGFMDESLLGFGIASEVRREELEGDHAVEFGVLGFVDDAHAAFAELLEDLVVGNGLANQRNLHGRVRFLRHEQPTVRR